MTKAYYRVSDFKQQVLDKRTEIFERGYDLGFHSSYPFLSLKKKYCSYCYASPFSGKTSFVFDSYMHIAKKYGAIFGIFSPESGGKEALVSYMVQIYLGKKLHGTKAQEATDAEWEEALLFIDKHFIILDPKMVGKNKIEFTTEVLFEQIYNAQIEYNCKIDIVLVDTHAMLRKNEVDRKKSISDYILDNLYYFNHVAESMDVHIQIIMHSTDESTQIDKDTSIEYIAKPHPNRIANGKNVWRTAQTLLGLWRCPEGVIDKSTGMPYPANATDFFVQKNKILGAGDVGSFRLFYDVERQKFYELIGGNTKYYCGEYEALITEEPSVMQPSKSFDDDIF